MVIKDKSSAIKYFFADKLGFSGGCVLLFLLLLFLIPDHEEKNVLDLNNFRHVRFDKDAELARKRNPNCSFYDCFNVYRCGNHQNKVTIYVYPLTEFSEDGSATWISKEFFKIMKTLISSPYYTSNPNEACIFVPSIDLLNQNLVDKNLVGKALASLK
jgi:glucuronyl/N-acetylglucosaminyl transferase EXT2